MVTLILSTNMTVDFEKIDDPNFGVVPKHWILKNV